MLCIWTTFRLAPAMKPLNGWCPTSSLGSGAPNRETRPADRAARFACRGHGLAPQDTLQPSYALITMLSVRWRTHLDASVVPGLAVEMPLTCGRSDDVHPGAGFRGAVGAGHRHRRDERRRDRRWAEIHRRLSHADAAGLGAQSAVRQPRGGEAQTGCVPQAARTSMRRGLAFSSFGRRSVSTPSFSAASMCSLSSSRLSVKLRR